MRWATIVAPLLNAMGHDRGFLMINYVLIDFSAWFAFFASRVIVGQRQHRVLPTPETSLSLDSPGGVPVGHVVAKRSERFPENKS